jgi:heme-degrading monooxygenase HmoA
MHARLSRFAGLTPERIEATLEQFRQESLPFLEQQKGYEGMLVLVNYNAGTSAGISFWSTEKDMRASEKAAEEARQRVVDTGQATQEGVVDRYEVVLNTLSAAPVA